MNADLLAWLMPAVAFAFAMCATPGPNNAMVASSGASFGFWPTMPHLLGVAAGFPAMLVVVALGGGNLLRAYPVIHETLKWIGAAYLLWLALRIATTKPEPQSENSIARPRETSRKPLSFLQAFLFQWVNPKAWIIALSAVTTYTTVDDVTTQTLLLAVIFAIVTLPTLALWTMTGVGAARLLRSAQAIRAFNIVMAVLLVASLLPLIRGG